MNEEWKSIIGYEGKYQVSNLGRVKSFARRKPIILKATDAGHGYLKVEHKQHKGYTFSRSIKQANC